MPQNLQRGNFISRKGWCWSLGNYLPSIECVANLFWRTLWLSDLPCRTLTTHQLCFCTFSRMVGPAKDRLSRYWLTLIPHLNSSTNFFNVIRSGCGKLKERLAFSCFGFGHAKGGFDASSRWSLSPLLPESSRTFVLVTATLTTWPTAPSAATSLTATRAMMGPLHSQPKRIREKGSVGWACLPPPGGQAPLPISYQHVLVALLDFSGRLPKGTVLLWW